MKTIDYFLIICLCLCIAACNSNDKPEVEEPIIKETVEVEDSVIEEPEVENPEIEDSEIEEQCPDLDDINAHFFYGDIPNLAARLAYMGMERPSDSYNYPLYQGMDEWVTLTNAEKSSARQVVPACLLSKMSTQALIQAIWEMPSLETFFSGAECRFQRAIENRRNFINAYEELYNRKDAGTVLLERLTLVDPLTPFLQYESQLFELLLSRPDFLSQLNENEKRKTVEIALSLDAQRYAAWWADIGDSGKGIGLEVRPVTWILIGNTMHAAGYGPLLDAMNENEELKYFIEGWRLYPSNPPVIAEYYYIEFFYGSIPELIIEFAKKYIKE